MYKYYYNTNCENCKANSRECTRNDELSIYQYDCYLCKICEENDLPKKKKGLIFDFYKFIAYCTNLIREDLYSLKEENTSTKEDVKEILSRLNKLGGNHY